MFIIKSSENTLHWNYKHFKEVRVFPLQLGCCYCLNDYPARKKGNNLEENQKTYNQNSTR